jgi:hypothetical protein
MALGFLFWVDSLLREAKLHFEEDRDIFEKGWEMMNITPKAKSKSSAIYTWPQKKRGPNCAKRGRRATHTRITFKSNDRFGGFQVVIEQPEGIRIARGDQNSQRKSEQPEGIRTARGDQNSQRGSDCARAILTQKNLHEIDGLRT